MPTHSLGELLVLQQLSFQGCIIVSVYCFGSCYTMSNSLGPDALELCKNISEFAQFLWRACRIVCRQRHLSRRATANPGTVYTHVLAPHASINLLQLVLAFAHGGLPPANLCRGVPEFYVVKFTSFGRGQRRA